MCQIVLQEIILSRNIIKIGKINSDISILEDNGIIKFISQNQLIETFKKVCVELCTKENELNNNDDQETLKPPNLVTMYIQCRNLPNLDISSKTDPFVKCYIREEKKPDW